MAAFSTIALAALGMAGVLGAGKALTRTGNDPMRSLGPGPSTALGRLRPTDSPVLGQAVPRATANLGNTPAAPDPTLAASQAAGAADAAAMKAKRRGASGSLLTGQGAGPSAPASLQPRTLIGY